MRKLKPIPTGRRAHTATRLADGRAATLLESGDVLIVGGGAARLPVATVVLWRPNA